MRRGRIWRTRKAIYELADGACEFYHTHDNFLCGDEVRGTQAGFAFAQTALVPCVYKVVRAQDRKDPYLAPDPGGDDGEEIVGLAPTHVGEPLLVADDDARELVGRALDIRIADFLFRRTRRVFRKTRVVTPVAGVKLITAKICRAIPRKMETPWISSAR